MSLYERAKDSLPATSWSPLLAGGLARALSGVATAPIELLRTRSQAFAAHESRGALASTLALARRDGVQALWRGATPTMARDVPFSCLYWALYEQLRWHLCCGGASTPTPALSMVAAAAAAAVAAVPTTPMDVIKTRAQVALDVPPDAAAPSVGRLLRAVYQREGLRGLFAGVVPRVTKVAPSCAIIVGAYEMGKVQLAKIKRHPS